MGLPEVKVSFVSQVLNGARRAERGALCIIVRDETSDFDYKTYTSLREVTNSDYTASNYADIARAFLAGPNKVIVVRLDSDGGMDDAKAILDTIGFDWLCSNVTGLQSGIVTYAKSVNTEDRARKVKVLVTGSNSADDEHVVNFANLSVTAGGDTFTGVQYVTRLAGILAACPLDRSVTGYELPELTAVSTIANLDASIDAGNLCLYLDGDTHRIARGVTTLQTISAGKIADMKKISVVEGMDICQQEIITLFKSKYLGKVKNDTNHQGLFIADAAAALDRLTVDGVLDPAYPISIDIDVGAMRDAWADYGVDVSALSDDQVRNKTLGSKIFVSASNLKFVDAMEDMSMVIQLG